MDQARFELATIDYAIIALYFVGVIGHGLWASRGKETAHDYFLAGGTLPWYLIGFSLFASNMSGASFVGLMGGAYANGMSIFNYEWTAAVVLLFFAIFVLPSFLRARLTTVPEFLEKRYDTRSRRAFSVFSLIAIMFIDTAGALYAGGLVIAEIIPPLELWSAVFVLAAVAGLYTILGGLGAVVVTDTVQAILLIVGGFVICLIGLREVGGYSQLMSGLSESQTSLIQPIGDDFLPWPGILGVLILGFYYFGINQFVVQRTLGARNLREGRRGALFAGFLKIPNLFVLILPGLIAIQLYPDLDNPDLAFPSLAFDMLPIGLRGLIAAALIAAIMSSLDSALNAAGTLVVKDFVVPLKPDITERGQLRLGRLVTGIAMVVGALYAPLIAGFESLFSYFQSSLSYVVPPIVVVYVLGLFTRMPNGRGAFWSILIGLVIGIPMFALKETPLFAPEGADSLWAGLGLPAIHFTMMSCLIALVSALVLLGLSATAARPGSDKLDRIVWDRADLSDEMAEWHRPLALDVKVLSLGLIVLTAGVVAWFW
ncbi:MAG: sodium/solute symporter [Paracoccaceae bacterium]